MLKYLEIVANSLIGCSLMSGKKLVSKTKTPDKNSEQEEC
jgi:hypothetical protein